MLLIAENLTELPPKLVSNPKVAIVEVPDAGPGERGARSCDCADPRLSEPDVDRYAEVTAGLKAIQIASILSPRRRRAEDDADARERFIAALLATSSDAAERAQKLAALTAGMTHDEIRQLIAPDADPACGHCRRGERRPAARSIGSSRGASARSSSASASG